MTSDSTLSSHSATERLGEIERDADTPPPVVVVTEQQKFLLVKRLLTHWWWTRIALSIGVPLLFFLVLRPEQYGLTPNGLDPVFYTGYAINFDDIMREVGGSHYFVTRWPAYLPSRFAVELFGAVLGRLMLRLCVAATMLMAVWHVGRRWRWNLWTELTVAVVIVTTPMFARAFMTDYVEWFVASVGFILVCQSIETPIHVARSAAIGVMGTLIVVCNPFAAIVVLGPSLLYGARTFSNPRNALRQCAVIVCAAATTLLAGWALFRYRYHIPNVYQPTLNLLTGDPPADPLRSPRLEWMGAFTWIYAPAILIAAALIIAPIRRTVLSDRARYAALLLLAMQYGLQWFNQFVMRGDALEISYYWSFICPTFLLAMAVVMGAISWTIRRSLLFSSCWIALLVLGSEWEMHIPAGLVFAVLALTLLCACAYFGGKWPAAAFGSVAVFLMATQVAAPRYDPSGYHPYNLDPRYRDVYLNANSPDVVEFREMLWFERTLDEIDDRGLFMIGGVRGSSIMAIYDPHTTGKALPVDPKTGELTEDAWRRIRIGQVPRAVVYGPPDFSSRTADELTHRYAGGHTIFRRTDPGNLGYELIVVDLNDPADGPFSWEPVDLPSLTGEVLGSARRARPGFDAPNVITFGPYVHLAPGRYRAQLTYSSPASSKQQVGVFDVAQSSRSWASLPIMGTDDAEKTIDIDFEVGATEEWQFRTLWTGGGPLTILGLHSEPIG